MWIEYPARGFLRKLLGQMPLAECRYQPFEKAAMKPNGKSVVVLSFLPPVVGRYVAD
jgi:hypothetical protein